LGIGSVAILHNVLMGVFLLGFSALRGDGWRLQAVAMDGKGIKEKVP